MQALCYADSSEEAEILKFGLQQVGLTVRWVSQLEPALATWSEQPADVAVLALAPHDASGSKLVSRLRAVSIVPVLVICDADEDMVVSIYRAGADLVLSRPFSLRLLGYQVRALLSRSNSIPISGLPRFTQGEVVLDPSQHVVRVGKAEPAHLTQLEFRLLYALMLHAGQILPAEDLVEKVWGYSGEGNRGLVRGLVQRLRAKVEPDPHNPAYIHTDPGVGYYFKAAADSPH